MLELRDIHKQWDHRPLLDGVSLSVAAGETVALLGASGSGKSTLLKIVAGLDAPEAGSVWFDGVDITALPPEQRGFALMFQDFALFPHLNLQDNVAFGLVEQGVRRSEARNQARIMLARFGLAGQALRKVWTLSGGEQQRVALARALITQPRVLLLDEPLSALDPFLRVQMRAELRRWQKELGLTFIHVTHSQEEAMALADTMVVMNHGRIEQVGPPHTVYNRPASEFVARFMGGHNVLNTTNGKVAVRNDHIQLAPAHSGNGWPATVSDVEYQGTYVLLGLKLNGTDDSVSVMLPEATFVQQPYAPGDSVNLTWAPWQAHTFPPVLDAPVATAA